jgi:hypothetical protein
MINDLSREPDKSMLGFSREVARDVTHPLWPSRVPLRISVSVILRDCVGDSQSRLTCDFEVEFKKIFLNCFVVGDASERPFHIWISAF